MTDFRNQDSASAGDEQPLMPLSADQLPEVRPSNPEDLPPVEPPSAGFIVQLFLIPALIVLVVIGVWALFGRLAAGEQDWRTLVTELRSQNEHRRWRGALGLAQMLKADEALADTGEKLAANPEVATELSELLREQLQRRSATDDDLKQQAFLARTLGFLDVPSVVLPVLDEAMLPEKDREIRKNAIASIALIAGRGLEQNRPLSEPELVDRLIAVSNDSDPFIRQLTTYTLGLFPDDAARERLSVLLEDADRNTRVNAAFGLARQKSSAGLPIFEAVLIDADAQSTDDKSVAEKVATYDPNEEFQELLILKNTAKAVAELAPELTDEQRTRFIGLLQPVANNHREVRIRVDARQAVQLLQAQD